MLFNASTLAPCEAASLWDNIKPCISNCNYFIECLIGLIDMIDPGEILL